MNENIQHSTTEAGLCLGDDALPDTQPYGVRREATQERHAAFAPTETRGSSVKCGAHRQFESGVAALLCHRTPKSPARFNARISDLGFWILNLTCHSSFVIRHLLIASFCLLPFASSALAQSNTNTLPSLAPAYGELKPTFWEQHHIVVLVGSIVLILLAGMIIWLLLRPRPPVPVPPETLARETFEKLRPQPENGKVLSEISHALRSYVVAAFGFPAGEYTTAEFSAALVKTDKIAADQAGLISCFLRECDERKFAPSNPSNPLNAAERALEIVSNLEKQRASLDVSIK